MRWMGLCVALMLGACGAEEPEPGDESPGAKATIQGQTAQPAEPQPNRQPQPVEAKQAPVRAEGAFRVWIEADVSDGASPPSGYRILRLPPDLENTPAGAQMSKREVLKGRWRDAAPGGQALFVDLQPSADVGDFKWMVVAYARNDLRQFPFAHEGYGHIELGTSSQFELQTEGGEYRAVVKVDAPLRVQPRFASGTPQLPMKFDFVYGPIASGQQRIRGQWSGSDPLPFLLSRYAQGREGYLTLSRTAWPSDEVFDKVEFELSRTDTLTMIEFPPLSTTEAMQVRARPADSDQAWAQAEIVGGYLTDEALPGVALFGNSDEDGFAQQDRALGGRYHLTARHPDSDDILLGWASHGRHSELVPIAQRPIPTTGRMHLQDLPGEGWQAEVFSFWGPLLVGRTQVTPEADGTLPHTGEMKHLAVAKRYDSVEERTEIIVYLECEWAGDHWHFVAEPTVCEVASFLQGDDLEMRLVVGQFPEPEQFFPPPQWQVEPGRAKTRPYFSLRFSDGAVVRGLAEGDYEAEVWGPAKTGGKAEELATFYPQAKREES